MKSMKIKNVINFNSHARCPKEKGSTFAMALRGCFDFDISKYTIEIC